MAPRGVPLFCLVRCVALTILPLCTAYSVIGNEYELTQQKNAGSLDFQWLREYGPTWATKGYFGVRIKYRTTRRSPDEYLGSPLSQAKQIMTADPKVS